MTTPDVDLAILGGGCAGLSLARRIASLDPRSPKVAVIEPRETYHSDRTWAFWRQSETDPIIDPLVVKRWPCWRIGTRERNSLHHLPSRPYSVVPAGRFYDDARRHIEVSANVRLHGGTRVFGIEQDDRQVRIETSHGFLTAHHVVDTRPPSATLIQTAIMHQVFKGVEIEIERPAFETHAVDLMTEMRVDEGGFVFTYALPFSATRALIEVTRFTETRQLPASLDAELAEAIDRRIDDSGYQVIRREQGVLPMGLSHGCNGSGRIVRAGTAAGAMRAATGYAFIRIQRWADLCAEAVIRGHAPLPHPPDPWVRAAMDRLFLEVIRRNPAMAPRLFSSLATQIKPHTFVGFLSDEAGPLDLVKIASALPTMPFLRTLATLSPQTLAVARRLPA